MPAEVGAAAQLFNFQWLARSDTRWLFLLFTYSSHRQLFINQAFFEQAFTPLALLAPLRTRADPDLSHGVSFDTVRARLRQAR
jgi:hypothetical protein